MKKLTSVMVVLLVFAFAMANAATAKTAATPARTPAKAAMKATPVKANPARMPALTITATVSSQDVNGKREVSLMTANGAEYEVAPAAQAQKIAKLEGKKIKVTGTVKEADGRKVITVKSFSPVKEATPK